MCFIGVRPDVSVSGLFMMPVVRWVKDPRFRATSLVGYLLVVIPA